MRFGWAIFGRIRFGWAIRIHFDRADLSEYILTGQDVFLGGQICDGHILTNIDVGVSRVPQNSLI